MADNKDIALIRHPDFRCFYAIGAVGVWTPHDFRINFYSEKVEEEEGDSLVNDVQVILPPRAVRELAVALTRGVRDYEKTHGVSLKELDAGSAAETKVVTTGAQLKDRGATEAILGPDFKEDLREDLRKDLTKDLKQDLKQDIQQDIKKDLEKGLKQDIKKGLKQDLRRDLKQDLRKDIQTEVRGVINADENIDKLQKEVKSSQGKIQQRGRRKVGRGRKTIKK